MTTLNSTTASAATVNDMERPSSSDHSAQCCHLLGDELLVTEPMKVPEQTCLPVLATPADVDVHEDEDESVDHIKDDKKRLLHNKFEKKRREHIKKGFIKLHQHLPRSKTHIKLSKLDILKTAVNYIYALHHNTQMLESEVHHMSQQCVQSWSSAGSPLSLDDMAMAMTMAKRPGFPNAITRPNASGSQVSYTQPFSPFSNTTLLPRSHENVFSGHPGTCSPNNACTDCCNAQSRNRYQTHS